MRLIFPGCFGIAIPAVMQQHRDGRGGEPRRRWIGSRRQHNRHAGANHDASQRGPCQIFQVLGQNVSGCEVGCKQDIHLAGDRTVDTLGERCFPGYGVVEGQWPVDNRMA